MKSRIFDAILAKNDLAEMIGELYTLGKIDSHDMRSIMTELDYIEAGIGEANQPSVNDSFENGINKVKNYPEFYGLVRS